MEKLVEVKEPKNLLIKHRWPLSLVKTIQDGPSITEIISQDSVKELSMDKYAVATDEEKTKTAHLLHKDLCPNCEQPLEEESAIPKCPKCGTEPFERKNGQETR